MSFILITYGYNQYSLFHIKTSANTGIDNVKQVSLSSIVSTLQSQESIGQGKIEESINKENRKKEEITFTEKSLKLEEEKEAELKKVQEEKEKQEALKAKKAADKGKKGKSPPPKKAGKKEPENETDNKLGIEGKEKITAFQTELSELTNNKLIYQDKKKKGSEILPVFRKRFKNKQNIKIDGIDSKGERANLQAKADGYANEFGVEKTVYELNIIRDEEESENESMDATGSINKDKKEDGKGKGKDKEKDKDKKGEKGDAGPILEPLKFDGFCMRSIDDDAKYEEYEKTNAKGGAKKPQKKK